MRVESRSTTVYIFTLAEKDHLEELGVWKLICARLMNHERIEVE